MISNTCISLHGVFNASKKSGHFFRDHRRIACRQRDARFCRLPSDRCRPASRSYHGDGVQDSVGRDTFPGCQPLAVVLAGTNFTGNSGKGCKLQGTSIGEVLYPLAGNWNECYWLKFFVTCHGMGDNEGPEVMELYKSCSNSRPHSWSSVRGIWQKVGPNKYAYTAYCYEFVKRPAQS